MRTTGILSQHGEGRLWVIALMLSLLINAAVVILLGLAAVKSAQFQKSHSVEKPAPSPSAEKIVILVPDATPAAPRRSRFARTSADQEALPPEQPEFLGERDTRATSDRAPQPTAPALPSQAGIEPRHPEDFETTESRYKEGNIDQPTTSAVEPSPAARPENESSPLPEPTRSGVPRDLAGKEPQLATPSVRERLLETPYPVEIPVARQDHKKAEEIQPKQQQPSSGEKPLPQEFPKPTIPKPREPKTAIKDPAFQSEQRKVAIRGSITRNGRSALNVADSPLGRYQALISRAVEQEWQRNCVRHRDFITPGFLTVRFYVESNGRVRSVQFVGDMETGEVQKGFTLNSIRNAEIPPMPAAVKKEIGAEPLELIFNFYF